MPTTEVHSYTLNVQGMMGITHSFRVLSVDAIEVDDYLDGKREGTTLCYNGMVEAEPVLTQNKPFDADLHGFKCVHTARDSMGRYLHDVNVPKDWDESHPKMQGCRVSGNQESYYAQKWV